MASSVKKIAAANTIAYGVSILVAFLQAPFLIHLLGDEKYGLWTLIGLLTGYYGLLDFGVRGGVGYFIARARAVDDSEALRETTSSAFAFLAAVGSVVLISASIAIPLLLRRFGVAASVFGESRSALWIAVWTLALSLPLDVYAAVISGSRRNEIVAFTETIVRVSVMLAIFRVLPLQPRLDTLATINLSGRAVVWITAIIITRRIEPRAALSMAAVRITRVREVLEYGIRSFLSNIAGTLIEKLDTVVIAWALGPARVTTYVVGQQLSTYIGGLVNAITLAFTPFFADLAARNDRHETRRLLIDGTRVSSLAALFISAGLFGFGSRFIALWVGDRFVSGPLSLRADMVLFVLSAAYLPRFVFSAGHQFLFGIRRHGFLAKALVVEGVVNISLSLVLVRSMGLVGVAIASLIPSLIIHGIVLPRFISKSADMSTLALYRFSVLPAVPPAFAIVLVGFVARSFPLDHWFSFFGTVVVASLIGSVLAWKFTLNTSERDQLRSKLNFIRALR